MSTKVYGQVFRALREQQGWTLDTMAAKFKALDIGITSRTGVYRLEQRGSDRARIIQAYETIFPGKKNKIEELVAKSLKNKLPNCTQPVDKVATDLI